MSPYLIKHNFDFECFDKIDDQRVTEEGFMIVVLVPLKDGTPAYVHATHQLFESEEAAAEHIHYLNGGDSGVRKYTP